MVETVKIEGLAEFESKLKELRDRFNVKTGGVIIRALREAAKVVARDAKARAPQVDPNFAGIDRDRQFSDWKARKEGKLKRRGRLGKKPTKALIKANIVYHPIPTDSRLANGLPTVIVRVRNRGYRRLYSLGGSRRGAIFWNKPGSSPGYWWWVEFGTSRFPARPFMRPAFEATKGAQLGVFRAHMAKEIDYLVRHKGVIPKGGIR